MRSFGLRSRFRMAPTSIWIVGHNNREAGARLSTTTWSPVISSISGDQHCNEMAQVLWDLLESGQIEKWTDLNGPVAEVDVAGGAPFGPGRYNYIRLNYQYFWAASSSHNYVGEALRHEYGHGHQPSAVHQDGGAHLQHVADGLLYDHNCGLGAGGGGSPGPPAPPIF